MTKLRDYDFITEKVIVLYDRILPLYIVKGKKNFLIDCGVTAKAQEYDLKINQILVDTLGAKHEGIQTLLLTHTHFDHLGAASYLQEKYKFNVLCSNPGIELLSKNNVIDSIVKMNWDLYILNMNPIDSYFPFKKLKNLGSASAGDRIEVDDNSYFEVIETPGHTKCSISFFLHPWKILFPGDSTGIILKRGVIMPLFLSSYQEFIQSVKELTSLEAEVLALPHNKFIKGREKVRSHLENSLYWAQQYKNEILKELNKESDQLKIAGKVYDSVFSGPTLLGSKEALLPHLQTMIRVVQKEEGNDRL